MGGQTVAMKSIGESTVKTATRSVGLRRTAHRLQLSVFGVMLTLVIQLALPSAEAQDRPKPPVETDTPAETDNPPDLTEGLWPSPKLMRLMLARWAEEASLQYGLDDAQRLKVREAAVHRWSRFLDENREVLQPLANEFVEMRMDLEPPPNERVRNWAKRAGPAFGRIKKQLDEEAEEFRQVLRPMQRAKFEVDALQMKVALSYAEGRIKKWQSGEFKSDEFWEPLRRDRQARRAERTERNRKEPNEALDREETREGETGVEDGDQIAIELDAWDAFVDEFIRTYVLDPGQRTTIASCLSELKRRALAHRDRNREEIDKLEERIASNSGTPEELADINKRLVELYGPIDDMFAELKSRIEQVPTADQRAAAAKRSTDNGTGQDSQKAISGQRPSRRNGLRNTESRVGQPIKPAITPREKPNPDDPDVPPE